MSPVRPIPITYTCIPAAWVRIASGMVLSEFRLDIPSVIIMAKFGTFYNINKKSNFVYSISGDLYAFGKKIYYESVKVLTTSIPRRPLSRPDGNVEKQWWIQDFPDWGWGNS